MKIDPEELAAFADGELSGARAAEVAAEVEADPELARQVAAHARVKAMLAARYDPILDAPVPEHLTALLSSETALESNVASFAAAREKREEKRRLPRWTWVAGPALAASLALALVLPKGAETPEGYAGERLATILDSRLVAEQSPAAETRVLLSFRDGEGQYCRAFSGGDASGIACRDTTGWKLEAVGDGGADRTTDYRMAGASDAELMAKAQDMAAGGALDATAENAARAQGWRPN